MLHVAFYPSDAGLGALAESEKQALAKRIFEIIGKDRGGFCISGVEEIFLLIPQEDRGDVARRAIVLGADAGSVQLCMSFAANTEAKTAAPGPDFVEPANGQCPPGYVLEDACSGSNAPKRCSRKGAILPVGLAPCPRRQPTGLSTGKKIAIGTGIAVGVIGLGALGLVLGRRSRVAAG